MIRRTAWRCGALLTVAVTLLACATAQTQQPVPRPTYAQPVQAPTYAPATQATNITPRLDPVAETKLLMEGLTNPNFRSIDRFLKQKPDNSESWRFIRGQALLIAESANLLMLRPPHNQGQAVWFERAMQMREAAKQLSQAAGKEEFERSRALLVNLANSCNRCHQSFRVATDVAPFQEEPAAPPPAKP